MAIFLETYAKTWNMCLAFLAFFVTVALLAWFIKGERLSCELPARAVFWFCLTVAFLLGAVCLTLIDEPQFAISAEMKDWLFMFSAFLGLPIMMPFIGGIAWASAHRLQQMPLAAFPFALMMTGLFAIGCAVSNIHDVVWCGAITSGYAQHYKAGYDLLFFVRFGNLFGIPDETLADYATLGPCALVLVAGELLVAAACFGRLRRLRNASLGK